MGLAISFKLKETRDSIAVYYYCLNFDKFDGAFEVDCSNISGDITEENEKDIYLNVITPCEGETEDFKLLGRVFAKIYKHYQKFGSYPEKGGHYAG